MLLSDDLYMSMCVSLLILEECEIHLGFAYCDTDSSLSLSAGIRWIFCIT